MAPASNCLTRGRSTRSRGIRSDAQAKSITGTARADVIRGTEGSDVIRGLAGNDTLRGRGGSDRLEGGLGNDKMFGDAGNDSLLAGGRPGFYDELHGGAGDDVLASTPGGKIHLIGGPGNDVLRGRSTRSAWSADTFSGAPGNDKIFSVDAMLGDAFFPNGCGEGYDLVELLRVPSSARAEAIETLRTVHGCERVVFR